MVNSVLNAIKGTTISISKCIKTGNIFSLKKFVHLEHEMCQQHCHHQNSIRSGWERSQRLHLYIFTHLQRFYFSSFPTLSGSLDIYFFFTLCDIQVDTEHRGHSKCFHFAFYIYLFCHLYTVIFEDFIQHDYFPIFLLSSDPQHVRLHEKKAFNAPHIFEIALNC